MSSRWWKMPDRVPADSPERLTLTVEEAAGAERAPVLRLQRELDDEPELTP